MAKRSKRLRQLSKNDVVQIVKALNGIGVIVTSISNNSSIGDPNMGFIIYAQVPGDITEAPEQEASSVFIGQEHGTRKG